MPIRTHQAVVLGQIVDDAIKASGHTVNSIAEATGLSWHTLKRRLKGSSFLVDELDAIAAELGTTGSALKAAAEAADKSTAA